MAHDSLLVLDLGGHGLGGLELLGSVVEDCRTVLCSVSTQCSFLTAVAVEERSHSINHNTRVRSLTRSAVGSLRVERRGVVRPVEELHKLAVTDRTPLEVEAHGLGMLRRARAHLLICFVVSDWGEAGDR